MKRMILKVCWWFINRWQTEDIHGSGLDYNHVPDNSNDLEDFSDRAIAHAQVISPSKVKEQSQVLKELSNDEE